jgi:hypothetical protein
MDKNEIGYVYIMTNKAMPGLVKIGYAKNVEARRKEFSNQTCIPYEFEVYGVFKTTKYAADKKVHTWFSEQLRVNKSREFFNVTPEYATKVIKDKLDEAIEIVNAFHFDNKSERRHSTYHLSQIGLKVGDVLTSVDGKHNVTIANLGGNKERCKVTAPDQKEPIFWRSYAKKHGRFGAGHVGGDCLYTFNGKLIRDIAKEKGLV